MKPACLLLPALLAASGPVAGAAPAAVTVVPAARLEAAYQELKTPYKWGPVLIGPAGTRVDNPRVFRRNDTWYMTYNHVEGDGGYECWLARSTNLVDWEPVGKLLAKGSGGWDNGSLGGFLGFQGITLDTACQVDAVDGRYWLSYLGGEKDGFEKYPLNIGLATVDDPTSCEPWIRLPANPILSVKDADTRWWEDRVLFASQLLRDPARTLGSEYLLVYNAKGKRDNVERIGIAASDDLKSWRRALPEPVISNDPDFRISGDPQLLKLDDLYVLLYARGVPAAVEVGDHETFSASYDLVHWTRWNGSGLTREREPWEGRTAAHKPWVFRWNGVIYHFFNYTHVIDGKPYGGIGVSTSRYLGKSFQFENLEIDRASRAYQVVSGMELDGYQGVKFRGLRGGDVVRFAFEVEESGDYAVRLAVLTDPSSGRFNVTLDGHPLAQGLDAMSPVPERHEFDLGVVRINQAGAHQIEFTLEGAPVGDTFPLLLDGMEWLKR